MELDGLLEVSKYGFQIKTLRNDNDLVKVILATHQNRNLAVSMEKVKCKFDT